MFSYSTETMNKMAENNPLLALMNNAMSNDAEQVKKTTDAWMKAIPAGPLPSQAVAAGAAMSAVGVGLYSQWLGTMYGAMSGAVKAAEHAGAQTKPAFFNPLNFEWGNVGEMDEGEAAKAAAPKAKPRKSAAKETAPPVVEKVQPKTDVKAVEPVATVAKKEAPAPKKTETPIVASKIKAQTAPVPKAEPVAEMKAAPAPAAPVVEPAAKEAAFEKPAAVAKPEKPDDLKLISGVGPKLEKVLNGLGVWTFAQIAEWTPTHVAWVDDFLQFSGRIERDDWIKQATELKSKSAK